MLGPMGAKIIDLLRIMTPNEIDRYVEKKEEVSNANIQLAAGAEDFNVSNTPVNHNLSKQEKKEEEKDQDDIQHEAKIIPINKDVQEQNSKSTEEEHEPIDPEQALEYEATFKEKELEAAGIFSAQKIEALKKEKLKRVKAKQESTSNFIIKEREKLKQTKLRLIEQDAIKNYNLNANVESLNDEIDIDNPDEEIIVGNKGILVNKKHY